MVESVEIRLKFVSIIKIVLNTRIFLFDFLRMQ